MPKYFFEDQQKLKSRDDHSRTGKAGHYNRVLPRLMNAKWFDVPRSKGKTTTARKVHNDPFFEKTTEDTLKLQSGSIALYGEGKTEFVRYISKPHGDTSGVTIGEGYDMGSKTSAQIIRDLTNAGVEKAQVEKMSKASMKTGKDAEDFVTKYREDIGPISDEAIWNLFQANWNELKATTKQVATSKRADKDNKGSYTNARGREINDGMPEGTYVLTTEEWNSLHPALTDLLTDMKFHGGYYIYDRVARINKAIKEHPNNQIGQLKAVRELFTNGYIEGYTDKLALGHSFSKVRNDTTDIFYGQKVNMKGKYKRDLIRLTFLDTVIAALESGKKVEIVNLKSSSSVESHSTSTEWQDKVSHLHFAKPKLQSHSFPNIASVGTEMAKEDRYQKGRAYFDKKINGKQYKTGDIIDGSYDTWCNQFAMDLAKKVTKDNPFKNIPGGQGNATVGVMLNFMKDNPTLFKELKIPFDEVWEKEINKGQLVFFIEPTHVATGVATERKNFVSIIDPAGKTWVLGNVVQAGNKTELLPMINAWPKEYFNRIKVFKYLGS